MGPPRNTSKIIAQRLAEPTTTREYVNGVDLNLEWSAWSKDATNRLATGCITFTTGADLTVQSGGTKESPFLRYNQLALIPSFALSGGLGYQVDGFCAKLSFLGGTFETTIDGQTTETVEPAAELGTVQTLLRDKDSTFTC